MNASTPGTAGRDRPPLASSLARLVPGRLLVSGLAFAHSRVEPELAGLDMFLPDRRRTALDVGAWYGPWTLALARRFDRVHAFEANPTVAARLRRRLPPGVTLHECAASDRSGSATLSAPEAPGTEGVGSLRPIDGSGGATVPTAGVTEVPVPLVRLDDVDPGDVDLLKIDVEGHELAVLRGGAGILERDRPVVIVELEERRAPTGPVVDLLTALGHSPHAVIDRRLVPFDTARLLDPGPPPPPSYTQMVRRPDLPRPINNVIFIPG